MAETRNEELAGVIERRSETVTTQKDTSEDMNGNTTDAARSDACHENPQSSNHCATYQVMNNGRSPPQHHIVHANLRRPLLNAKRKLSFHQLPEIPPITSTSCDNVLQSEVTESNRTSDDSPGHKQDEHSTNRWSEPFVETGSVKTSCHIQSSPASLKAISPLTNNTFKAFHIHRPQAVLEVQQSHSKSTPSPTPIVIPSLSMSVPCLVSSYPVPQPLNCRVSKSHSQMSTQKLPFSLELPPQGRVSNWSPSQISSQEPQLLNSEPPPQCRVPKSFSLMSSEEPSFKSDSNSVRNSDHPHRHRSQPSSSMGVATCTSHNSVVYTTSTSSNSCCTSSVSQSKSGHGSSTSSVVKSNEVSSGSKSNMRSQQSYSRGDTRLKQVLLQGSSQQQSSQPPFRCPRRIHCDNCGHKIDLKTYLKNLQLPRGEKSSTMTSHPAGKSLPVKLSVTDAGLTVLNLETICDTGCIDHSLSVSTEGDQRSCQRPQHQGSNAGRLRFDTNHCSSITTELDKSAVRSSSFSDLRSMRHLSNSSQYAVIEPHFPHSDELTQSFAPISSDTHHICKQMSTLAECWEKLDSLDVDEMLQLVEATSDIRYCSKSSSNSVKVVANGQSFVGDGGNKETLLESLQPANHIITETVNCAPCPTQHKLHTSSGKTLQAKQSSKNVHSASKLAAETITNSINESDGAHSDGSVCSEEPCSRKSQCGHKKQTSRICKKRRRKKVLKRTNKIKKNNKQ